MKFFKLGMKYTFKNFIKYLPFVIITAVLCSLSMNVFSIWDYLFGLQSPDSISLYNMYIGLSLVVSSKWYLSIPAALSFVVVFGIIICLTDRHMRIGKFSFKFYRYFSYAFIICAPIIIILILIYEFMAFIFACLIVCLELFISIYAIPYIAIGLYTIGLMIIIFIITKLTLWIPSCTVQGYRFFEGLSSSIRNSKETFYKIFIAWLIPFLVIIFLGVLGGIFIAEYMMYINIVLYSIALIYASALVMSTYFDMNDYERRDIKFKLF